MTLTYVIKVIILSDLEYVLASLVVIFINNKSYKKKLKIYCFLLCAILRINPNYPNYSKPLSLRNDSTWGLQNEREELRER